MYIEKSWMDTPKTSQMDRSQIVNYGKEFLLLAYQTHQRSQRLTLSLPSFTYNLILLLPYPKN